MPSLQVARLVNFSPWRGMIYGKPPMLLRKILSCLAGSAHLCLLQMADNYFQRKMQLRWFQAPVSPVGSGAFVFLRMRELFYGLLLCLKCCRIELRHLEEREMSDLIPERIPGKASTHGTSGLPVSERTKFLPNTECPACFRKGTLEVFFQKHGELTFCYSCGHREMAFNR